MKGFKILENIKKQVLENPFIYFQGLIFIILFNIEKTHEITTTMATFAIIFLTLSLRKVKKIKYKNIIISVLWGILILLFLVLPKLIKIISSEQIYDLVSFAKNYNFHILFFLSSLVILSFIFSEEVFEKKSCGVIKTCNKLFYDAGISSAIILIFFAVIGFLTLALGQLFGISYYDFFVNAYAIVGTFTGIFVFILLNDSDKISKNNLFDKIFYGAITFFQFALGIIILIYILITLKTFNLPKNVLGKYVIFYFTVGLIKIFLFEDDSKTKKMLTKIFWFTGPIFVLIYFISLYARISEYGLTSKRYSTILIGIFFIISHLFYFFEIIKSKLNSKNNSEKIREEIITNNILKKIAMTIFILANIFILTENFVLKKFPPTDKEMFGDNYVEAKKAKDTNEEVLYDYETFYDKEITVQISEKMKIISGDRYGEFNIDKNTRAIIDYPSGLKIYENKKLIFDFNFEKIDNKNLKELLESKKISMYYKNQKINHEFFFDKKNQIKFKNDKNFKLKFIIENPKWNLEIYTSSFRLEKKRKEIMYVTPKVMILNYK
ncbi:MAG: hypothetical protein ACRCSK_04285 [Fusobacteriaceae bacterium]